MKLRAKNYDDPKYDTCGNITIAVLEVNNIAIPLCDECVDQLFDDLNIFRNTLFCYKCCFFMPNESGWSHGGSCRAWALACGDVLRNEDVGYRYCVGPMDTCDTRKRKQQT